MLAHRHIRSLTLTNPNSQNSQKLAGLSSFVVLVVSGSLFSPAVLISCGIVMLTVNRTFVSQRKYVSIGLPFPPVCSQLKRAEISTAFFHDADVAHGLRIELCFCFLHREKKVGFEEDQARNWILGLVSTLKRTYGFGDKMTEMTESDARMLNPMIPRQEEKLHRIPTRDFQIATGLRKRFLYTEGNLILGEDDLNRLRTPGLFQNTQLVDFYLGHLVRQHGGSVGVLGSELLTQLHQARTPQQRERKWKSMWKGGSAFRFDLLLFPVCFKQHFALLAFCGLPRLLHPEGAHPAITPKVAIFDR
eukprot:RCo048533